MKMERNESTDDIQFRHAVIAMNFKILGLVLGFLLGSIIFLATNWLLLKGGETSSTGTLPVGPHLQLLGQFFIGYSVTFAGSIVGFFYGFALGSLTGAALSFIYNKLVTLRGARSVQRDSL